MVTDTHTVLVTIYGQAHIIMPSLHLQVIPPPPEPLLVAGPSVHFSFVASHVYVAPFASQSVLGSGVVAGAVIGEWVSVSQCIHGQNVAKQKCKSSPLPFFSLPVPVVGAW